MTLTQYIERRRSRYRRAARRYEALHRRVDRVISIVATVRFLSFTVFAVCTFAAFQDRAYGLYLPIAGVAALIFAPELMDAGAFVLAKSLDANAVKVIENALYGLGMLLSIRQPAACLILPCFTVDFR